MKNIININDDVGATLELAFEYMSRAHTKGKYININESHIMDAYNRARKNRLRYDRKNNILRDDRLGVLARPSNPSEWDVATIGEARDWIAHEVWCAAVAAYNREFMA